jgi:hypothetical protein
MSTPPKRTQMNNITALQAPGLATVFKARLKPGRPQRRSGFLEITKAVAEMSWESNSLLLVQIFFCNTAFPFGLYKVIFSDSVVKF